MTKLKIPLHNIQKVSLEKTPTIVQELLREFDSVLGPYMYDDHNDQIYWAVEDNLFAEFSEALGQELYFKLHILFPNMTVE